MGNPPRQPLPRSGRSTAAVARRHRQRSRVVDQWSRVGSILLLLSCAIIIVQPKWSFPRSEAGGAGAQPVELVGTADEISYFLEIALGSEFGPDSAINSAVIRKWQSPVIIRVQGAPTAEDLETLGAVIAEINAELAAIPGLTPEMVSLIWDDNHPSPNLSISFLPEAEFSQVEPNYRPGNLGFFWTYPNAQGVIQRATVLISTSGVTQQERSHLIREELTQSLGLMNDSWRDQASIFYQGWTDSTTYTELDRKLIRWLYSPRLQPGMGMATVRQVLPQHPHGNGS